MKDDSKPMHHTQAQDSLTFDYIAQEVVQKSLTISYLKQPLQNPVATPVQGSSGQSGTGSDSTSQLTNPSQTTNQK